MCVDAWSEGAGVDAWSEGMWYGPLLNTIYPTPSTPHPRMTDVC